MRKVFKMEELDCANCAAKIQEEVAKLDGVNKVSVNFMTQKFTLDADDDKFDSVLDEAQKICTKHEPDCTILR